MLCAGVLAGCGSAPGQEPDEGGLAAEAAIAALPDSVEQVWSVDARAVRTPEVVGETLVAPVVARGDELDVVGLDLASGEELWRHPLHPSAMGGTSVGDLAYEAGDGTHWVVFQLARTGEEVRDEPRPYVAVDPADGRIVRRSAELHPVRDSYPCDDELDMCTMVRRGDDYVDVRWDLASGKLRDEAQVGRPGSHQLDVGSEVRAVMDGNDRSYMGLVEVARVGAFPWRRSAVDIAGDDEWFLRHEVAQDLAGDGLVVVQVDRMVTSEEVQRYESGEAVPAQVADDVAVVALDRFDGQEVWRREGDSLHCRELSRVTVPVRCAVGGSVVYAKDQEPSLREATVDLEGYHPLTGETTWQVRLDDDATRVLLTGELDAPVVPYASHNDAFQVVPGADGAAVLALADGTTQRLADDATLLCPRTLRFRHVLDRSGSVYTPMRRMVSRSCTADGAAVAASPGAVGIVTGGVEVGDGAWAVAYPDRISRYAVS